MISRRISHCIGILFCVVLLHSCQSKYDYEQFEPIAENGWKYTDSLSFEFDIIDTNAEYNLYILPRHSTDYMWQNFWVMTKTIYPDGTAKTQRVELPMADKKGKWYGKGIGNTKQNEVIIQENAKMPQAGKYKILISQDMRYEPVLDILELGFRVDKKEQ